MKRMTMAELIGKLSTFDPNLAIELAEPGELTNYPPALIVCPVVLRDAVELLGWCRQGAPWEHGEPFKVAAKGEG